MKKTYISPASNAIQIHCEGFLANSEQLNNMSVDRTGSITEQSGLLSGKKDYSSEIWGE